MNDFVYELEAGVCVCRYTNSVYTEKVYGVYVGGGCVETHKFSI